MRNYARVERGPSHHGEPNGYFTVPSPSSATNAIANPENSSTRWFADEVHTHDSDLRAYLRRAFPVAKQEVDDVVQESYVRIWKARAGQPLQCAKAFLFTVARHVTLDLLRRHRASPVGHVGDLAALPVVDESRGVAETVSIDEKIQLLVQGLAALPPRGRDVVVLRKFRGRSQKEVAAQLGISEKTVDEHLCRAMKRLGEFLRERGVSSYYDR